MPTRLTAWAGFIARSSRKQGGAFDDLVQVGWVSVLSRRHHRGVAETQKRYVNAQRSP